ncbi:MAG: DUF3243 family protein [Firmicutes bacterium]|nr:DUF3243 family protein [Bacillota bacterium]
MEKKRAGEKETQSPYDVELGKIEGDFLDNAKQALRYNDQTTTWIDAYYQPGTPQRQFFDQLWNAANSNEREAIANALKRLPRSSATRPQP